MSGENGTMSHISVFSCDRGFIGYNVGRLVGFGLLVGLPLTSFRIEYAQLEASSSHSSFISRSYCSSSSSISSSSHVVSCDSSSTGRNVCRLVGLSVHNEF